MAMQKQATRRRLARLAYECGLESFSKTEAGDEVLGLTELLNEVPDAELGEFEVVLKDLQVLQVSLRSLN